MELALVWKEKNLTEIKENNLPLSGYNLWKIFRLESHPKFLITEVERIRIVVQHRIAENEEAKCPGILVWYE